MSVQLRQRSTHSDRLSLDEKVLEQTETKSLKSLKDNYTLFTALNGYYPSPKAEDVKVVKKLHRRKISERTSVKPLSEPAKLTNDAKSLWIENQLLKEKVKELNSRHESSSSLRVSELEEAVEKLKKLLKIATAENTRVKNDIRQIEGVCKEACFLLTANGAAATQKVLIKLKGALTNISQTNFYTSRSTPYLTIEEEPRLDDGLRYKSKTTSNKSLGRAHVRSPYHSSPGRLKSSAKLKKIRSPVHLALNSTSKSKRLSNSRSRSDSPLDSQDTQLKLKFIKEKTKAILEAWSSRNQL